MPEPKTPPRRTTKPPDEVEVVNEEPLKVEVAEAEPPKPVKSADGALTLPPTTTDQQDKTTEGQRRINLIWENTQSRIALLVVSMGFLVNSAVIVLIVFFGREVSVTQLALISICLQFINLTAGMVIGFYFSRTNHAAIGGVGAKPMEPYVGR